MLTAISWDVPAELVAPILSRSGAPFFEKARAFAVGSGDDPAHVERIFDNERLAGSQSHAAIEGPSSARRHDAVACADAVLGHKSIAGYAARR
jgi:hypothetical protein